MTLSQLLKRDNLTGYKLAKRLDIRIATVYDWLRGKCVPHPVNQKRLARIFKVSVKSIQF